MLTLGWLGRDLANAPTVGGFLYATLASLRLSWVADRLRRLSIDVVHHHADVRKHDGNYRLLVQHLDAVSPVRDETFEDEIRSELLGDPLGHALENLIASLANDETRLPAADTVVGIRKVP